MKDAKLQLQMSQGKKTETPQPATEMSHLGFFIGVFKCIGEALPTLTSDRHPVERTITGKMDLDGFWLFMRFEDENTKENPAPNRGNYQVIYDSSTKGFVAVWTDNRGNWFTQTSTGWKNDVITFTEEFFEGNQRKQVVRDIFTRKSETEMIQVVEIQKKGGEWTRFLELTCRKLEVGAPAA
jgi:hypothetical protein